MALSTTEAKATEQPATLLATLARAKKRRADIERQLVDARKLRDRIIAEARMPVAALMDQWHEAVREDRGAESAIHQYILRIQEELK